jgi:mono/diheme cytochrome c family protein
VKTVCPALALLLLAVGCGEHGTPENMPQRWDTSLWSPEQIQHLEHGRRLYTRRCAACHRASGLGQMTLGAPALKGSAIVTGPVQAHIAVVLNGRGKVMPAFGNVLDTRALADIINYERNAWGNSDPHLIGPADIEAQKAH